MKTKIISVTLLLCGFAFFSEVKAQEFPTPPNEIQNVEAVVGDGFVDLSWERGTDPDGVVVNYKIYYGTSSVQTEEGLYDDEIEVGNVLTYKVTGLTNGTEYFFAVTGIDDEGIEGETYSAEVSAVPEGEVIEEIIPEPIAEIVPEEELIEEIVPVEEVIEEMPEETVNQEVEASEGIVEGPVYPSSPVDTVSPLDAMNLSVDSTRLESENIVLLQWEISPNTDGDVQDQILYTRRGMEDWDGGYSLGAELNMLELEVDIDENYEVKVVTVDQSGNESKGITLSFSTSLSKTGPESIGTVVALTIVFIAGFIIFSRRKAY